MDNRELVDAANGLIQWANSQSIKPSDLERVMLKLQARIICDRLGIKRGTEPPTRDAWDQELLKSGETLMHEIVSRIYSLHGRR